MGFFAPSQTLDKPPAPTIPRCGACGLFETCNSPKIQLAGKGRRKILIVGEAPGETEDEQGKPFIGRAGKLLRESLADCEIQLWEDCWITNALLCRPPDNRDPTPDELRACRPNLVKAIEKLKPEIIVPLGRFGIAAVVSQVWKEAVGSGQRWVGWQIPCQRWNAWICPTWHPAFIARKIKQPGGSAEGLLFAKHLEKMSELRGRPWKNLPDYKSLVRVETDQEAAADWLHRIRDEDVVSFDYETNMLKPDSDQAKIYSCAVCVNGERAIAYPWYGNAVEATGVLLRSAAKKIGANIKFEERWTRRAFGHGVRNWVWDGNLAAHVLDNRRGITSVKFQAFVLLGQSIWNDRTAPFLKGPSNGPSRIAEIDLMDLLEYNGLDAVLEYHIARKQKEVMRENR